jgi:hypothetical protein
VLAFFLDSPTRATAEQPVGMAHAVAYMLSSLILSNSISKVGASGRIRCWYCHVATSLSTFSKIKADIISLSQTVSGSTSRVKHCLC